MGKRTYKKAFNSKAKKYAKKSRSKGKFRYRTTKLRNNISMGLGFPKKIQFTHKFHESVQFNTSNGTGPGFYFWSANGMYDPNISGGGHQPMYFDQLGALYNHYCVIGSKITARLVVNDSATQQKPINFIGMITDNTTPASVTNINTLIEQSLAKKVTLMPGMTYPGRVTLKWSAKKFFGKGVLANTELQGTTSANPTEQTYYMFCVLDMDGVTALNCWLEVDITYIAVWKEIIDIGGS